MYFVNETVMNNEHEYINCNLIHMYVCLKIKLLVVTANPNGGGFLL